MPSSDLTTQFRTVVNERQNQLPDAKRRKIASKPARSTPGRNAQAGIGKEYLAEAYVVLNHINTLTRMLGDVRKAYLNVDSRDGWGGRHTSRTLDLNKEGFSWADVRHLANEERDQIDLQARVVLTRCAERVKEMEALEKRRSELVASQSNPLARLIPTRLRQDTTALSSDFLAAHHSGVTWYLSRRLAEVSQAQKEMQEERVKRQMERTRSLGSGAAREVREFGQQKEKGRAAVIEQPRETLVGSWLGDASSSILAVTGIGTSSRGPSTPGSVPAEDIVTPSDDEEEMELSQSQILQFETENANILRAVQDTLESVQQAEQRLTDISVLQMELVTHLTKQTELTDQLYEDAITTTSTVEKGNEQLKEAKRRAKDSRLFILVFLVGASFSLLFLHYY